MSIFTFVPTSGIPADTSKATRKAPTQAQRDDKNAKLRAKRAAQAAAKAPTAVKPSAPPVVVPPAPLPVVVKPLALDALPRTIVKGKASAKLNRTGGIDKGGRRAIYGEPMHTVSFKCTKLQHATFLRAGGNVYLRDRLDELAAGFAKADAKLRG